MHIPPEWEWIVECKEPKARVEGSAASPTEARRSALAEFEKHPRATTQAEIIGPRGAVLELVPDMRPGRRRMRWQRARCAQLVLQ